MACSTSLISRGRRGTCNRRKRCPRGCTTMTAHMIHSWTRRTRASTRCLPRTAQRHLQQLVRPDPRQSWTIAATGPCSDHVVWLSVNGGPRHDHASSASPQTALHQATSSWTTTGPSRRRRCRPTCRLRPRTRPTLRAQATGRHRSSRTANPVSRTARGVARSVALGGASPASDCLMFLRTTLHWSVERGMARCRGARATCRSAFGGMSTRHYH
mmetsp:Transcript_11391/g.36391  ORF Transcript_11391/g.36391 Transcript_11391/m.36391 type:complete len:214 (+) Transcript_11391:378-1019(+)